MLAHKCPNFGVPIRWSSTYPGICLWAPVGVPRAVGSCFGKPSGLGVGCAQATARILAYLRWYPSNAGIYLWAPVGGVPRAGELLWGFSELVVGYRWYA